MYSVWAKRLLPAPVATGTVCLTMHLTNQQKDMLDSLGLLSLENKPEIIEDELKPKVVVPPKQAGETGSGGEAGKDSKPDTDDDQQDSVTDDTQQQPQTDSDSVTQSSKDDPSSQVVQSPSAAADPASSVMVQTDIDIREVLRRSFQEITDKYPK